VQRLNAALALAAAVVALQQPLGGWAGGGPAALARALAGGAAVAGAAGRVLLALRPLGGGVEFAATAGPSLGGPGDVLDAAVSSIIRTATSLPACLLALLTLTSAAGAWGALTSAPPAGYLDPGVGYLRGLLAAGLVVLAAQAAALIEAAQDVCWWTTEQAVKYALVMQDLAERPLPAGGDAPAAAAQQQRPPAKQQRLPPGAAPRGLFEALHLGLFASLAMQGAWLALGRLDGLPINSADPVWALQYWSVMIGAAYLVSVVRVLDWEAVWGLAINALGWAGGVLSFVLSLTFMDFDWLSDARR
jgi:hypothetical protein